MYVEDLDLDEARELLDNAEGENLTEDEKEDLRERIAELEA
ncbi:hypothetical protein KIY76_gp70 [Mycobacterium phage Miramae]|uniref:Uncharacterized protein n=1 Tax=Mycobacterium phage Miramae TaxID=2517961 RepID=A0A482JFY4_9CAUD|nr:hypothetical protein KIY76_gp70 [Mycobacterium phage Miramae]QBP31455.1 hypothetical protein SEA_MIRAMAE_70 [Mycobacterium phage Miramae]QBP32451.1 hypothetical protein SEA_AVATARAHPEG_70 [Mycobacterium phage AvatarAhPeg]